MNSKPRARGSPLQSQGKRTCRAAQRVFVGGRARLRPLPVESSIAGIVSGEFDRIPEANDAFLELVGYSRSAPLPISARIS
jgi:hypothetical protein